MIGTKLAHYDVTSHLGTGGMGEVYQATDSKLGRSVAIKLLPEVFTHDHDRVSRFEREARVLASLNHPNIAAIHGIEETGGRKFLVMELVLGETLEERIRRGPIPLDEALGIAKEITEGLEAAHEKGVIHRDLKPANVKITPEGKVKVLDFGLAKAYETDGPNSNLSNSPTMASMATNAGMILGTAAYMSPEQASGKPVDKRADIWSFGVILWEMLTGRGLFGGETVSHVLASVLKSDPDWTTLPASTPSSIRKLLRRCLEKDRKRRLDSAAAARLEIEDAGTVPEEAAPPGPQKAAKLAWIVAAILFLGMLALAIPIMVHFREPSRNDASEMRVEIATQPQFDGWIAISPDGRMLVFGGFAQGEWRLWVRPMDSNTTRPLTGTEGGVYPFWSPDSRSLGFFSDGRLKRIEIAGGPAQTLARTPEPRGGAWGSDGTILFAPEQDGPLYRINSKGSEPAVATHLEAGQVSHRFPSFLPDGRHFLYYSSGNLGTYIGSIDDPASQRLFDSDSMAIYSPPGFLLFRRQKTLLAQHFDVNTLQVTGNPFPVGESVSGILNTGSAGLSADTNGTIAFSTIRVGAPRLAWFDRSGKEIGGLGSGNPDSIVGPELSPDGTHVAVQQTVGNRLDVWLTNIARNIPTRLNGDVPANQWPLWSPDGTRIVFSSSRKSNMDLFQAPSSGNGPEEVLMGIPGTTIATSWSSDGRFILFGQLNPKTGFDLLALPLFGDRKPLPLANRGFDELAGDLSKDMRWIAYESNESGRFEIVVQPFMEQPGGRLPITNGGGRFPRWRSDGKELFYIAPDGALMGVPIAISKDGKALEPGKPLPLLLVPGRNRNLAYTGPTKPNYTVTADGQRFLMVVGDNAPSPITLILNWKPPAE
jgi:Tol biopolymer transport system component